MRKIHVISLLAFCLISLLVFSLSYPRIHDWNLKRLKASLSSISHPNNTTSIKFVQDVGNLVGTHDQIDYFVGDVRKYSGSKEQIRSFYSRLKIWNPIAKRFDRPEIVFSDETSENAQSLAWSAEINQWSIFPKNKKTYIIYIFDGGYWPGSDGRGY